jgi:hypothetical protein
MFRNDVVFVKNHLWADNLWIDRKYVSLLSPQLEHFRWKSKEVSVCRCPLCGDSAKDKTKTRFYLYPHKGHFMAKCHNCGISLPFAALLRRVDRRLYDEYLLDKLRENEPVAHTHAPMRQDDTAAVFTTSPYQVPLPHCASPEHVAHAAYVYAVGRGIPEAGLARLSATTRAYSWLKDLVGEDKAARVVDDEVYLILPLRLQNGSWYGAQLRPLNRKEYITFRWAAAPLKTFGLESWDPTKTTYLVEGPIDALFLPNALAICGSDLLGGVRVMEEAGLMTLDMPRVFVWDNEPHNKEVSKHMRHAISAGESLVIWPKGSLKDLNDMHQAGIDVPATVAARTFTSLRANLEYSTWKR